MAQEREPVIIKGTTPIKSEAEIKSNQADAEKGNVTMNEPLVVSEEMSEEEKEGRRRVNDFFALPVSERVAKLTTILDRGVLHDRFKVGLPDDLHGEWARNDPLEIDRMRSLGFWVDNTYATKRSIHSDGSSANVVGDVIHMCTTKHNKELIDLVRFEQSRRALGRSRTQRDAEEEDFAHATARDTGEIIPTFADGRARSVTAADVRSALTLADSQTRVQR